MNLLQAMMIAALLLGGLGVALLGSIKVALARKLQIDEAKVGGLVSLFGFTMIPVILTAGFLTDLVGRQVVMIGGSALFAASLAALGLARCYAQALGSVILFSAAWSLTINVGNVLVPLAFGGTTAFATNFGNVLFGLGAFLTPIALGSLVQSLGLRQALFLLAAFALVPGALAFGVDFTVSPGTEAGGGQETSPTAPLLWILGFALFFYGPLEASMAAWATTLLTNHGVKETQAAGLLSGFWLAFMASRLLTAFLLPAGAERWLILVLAVICIGVLFAVVQARTASLAMLLVPIAGFVFGPIFPTLMAILLGHFAPEVQGRAVGMFFAIGGVGWTVIPILIGLYAARTSVRSAFGIAVGAAAGLSAVAAVLLASK
ncbi:MAG: MFS transporter [Gemmataceae bacterium]|nr:MFS transporter [Gemmataceae bacterium]MCI0737900.1 MFS transporter [Gemmataceae bacterium]